LADDAGAHLIENQFPGAGDNSGVKTSRDALKCGIVKCKNIVLKIIVHFRVVSRVNGIHFFQLPDP